MLRPPEHVVAAIRRVFPLAKLVWWRKEGRWALVFTPTRDTGPHREAVRPQGWQLIHIYKPGEKLSVKNTVGLLREADVSHLKTRWDVDRWLERRVDRGNNKMLAEADEKRREAAEEAAKRMVWIERPSISIVNPWSRYAPRRGRKRRARRW